MLRERGRAAGLRLRPGPRRRVRAEPARAVPPCGQRAAGVALPGPLINKQCPLLS